MVWPAIIGAGASLLGGVVSAFGQSRAQSRSEDFSREMYDYALLNGPAMEMEGLRRAGINPMLRYGSGGSGVPVSMPTMNFGNAFGDLGAGIAGASSSAFGNMKTAQEVEKSRAETVSILQRLPADLAKIEADTNLTTQQRFKSYQEMGLVVRQQALTEAQTRLSEQEYASFEYRMSLLDAQRLAALGAAASSSAEAALRNAALSRADYESRFYETWFGEVVRGVGITVDNLTGGSTPTVSR